MCRSCRRSRSQIRCLWRQRRKADGPPFARSNVGSTLDLGFGDPRERMFLCGSYDKSSVVGIKLFISQASKAFDRRDPTSVVVSPFRCMSVHCSGVLIPDLWIGREAVTWCSVRISSTTITRLGSFSQVVFRRLSSPFPLSAMSSTPQGRLSELLALKWDERGELHSIDKINLLQVLKKVLTEEFFCSSLGEGQYSKSMNDDE